MLDDQFIHFLELLRVAEKNDIEGNSTEDAIISLMDMYEQQLTGEQKKALLDEFIEYKEKGKHRIEQKRRQREADENARFSSRDIEDFF